MADEREDGGDERRGKADRTLKGALDAMRERGRIVRENNYKLVPEELQEANIENVTAVTTLVRDLPRKGFPTMSDLISIIAGEEGRNFISASIRDRFLGDWRPKLRQNLDREQTEAILDVLEKYASAKGHDPKAVRQEYTMRLNDVAASQEHDKDSPPGLS